MTHLSSTQTTTALTGARWPTYKVYGNPPSVALEACVTNLHTSVLDVINSGASSPTSSYEDGNDGMAAPKTHTSYCVSTMAIPTVDDKPLSVSQCRMSCSHGDVFTLCVVLSGGQRVDERCGN